jgi:type II secretory pathway pseudopilin PulG
MIVVSVLGIVMAIAIPAYVSFIRNTRAAQAAADLYAVRSAAYLYYGDNATWPRETPTGDIPAELAPYLPGGFSFRRPHYTLDYDNWGAGRGRLGQYFGRGIAVGISVQSADAKLGPVVRGVLGNTVFLPTQGRKYTLEICSVRGF